MKAKRPTLRKQLGILFAVAFSGTAIIGSVVIWEERTAPPPERVVRIYGTHGCTCVIAFAQSLTAAGYDVRLVELQSLAGVRDTLRSPPDLNGCHVGSYLGYFLEGHVSPSALLELALTRPPAAGVATEASALETGHVSIARDEHSVVFLVESDGARRAWFQPNDPPRE